MPNSLLSWASIFCPFKASEDDLGFDVGESAEITLRGVAGQAVEVSLTDVAGNRLHQQQLPRVSTDERVVIPVSARQAITVLRVSTGNQHQTVRLIRP